ncbi:hypothetical protein ABK040_006744 [Willaertia magna]
MRAFDDYELYENGRRFLIVPKVVQQSSTSSTSTGTSGQSEVKRKVPDYEHLCLIDRDTQLISKLSIDPNNEVVKTTLFKKMRTMTRIFGIIGSIKLLSGTFLVVLLEREYIGMINKHKIYKIKKIQFIPFKPSKFKIQTEEQKEKEIQYIEMMNKVIVEDNSFYFSYTLDLTNRFQRTFSTNEGLDNINLQGWKNAHPNYFWNKYLLQQFISKQMDGFIIPMIRGIVEMKNIVVNNISFLFGIISRTSSKRAGARYIMRGSDEKGHVANFVESEQFIYYNSILTSFLQIRGSIPLIWSQEANLKYTPEIKFLTDKEKQLKAFHNHFNSILKEYQNNITAINLCKKTGQESRLSELYTNYVKNVNQVNYVHFDFHNECKNHDYTKLYTMFLPQIVKSMKDIKFFSVSLGNNNSTWIPDDNNEFNTIGKTMSTPLFDTNEWEDDEDSINNPYSDNNNRSLRVQQQKSMNSNSSTSLLDFGDVNIPNLTNNVSQPNLLNFVDDDDPFMTNTNNVKVLENQNGTFRVNCIDCCDRTNYIETFIAKYLLIEQLYRLSIIKKRDVKLEELGNLEQEFRQFWLENGDKISILYSGTGALKFHKSVQGLLTDGVNSAKRYFLNNFKDTERQKSINLVLGLLDVNNQQEEEEESNNPAEIVKDLLIF